MTLATKRIIVVVASLLIGALTTFLTIYVVFSTEPKDFAYSNVVLLFLSVASMAGIWLDLALDTQFLQH